MHSNCLLLFMFLLIAICFVTPLLGQTIELRGDAGGKRFDGIGVVNGGGATSVLLKDYPEPQRSQILDLLYKPKFGASVSALLVEIPGDGNSTQGSMPSHMHTRDDLNYHRGYTWWILQQAKRRNPNISLDATAWSAPGWIGNDPHNHFRGEHGGDAAFWSEDTGEYYIKWLLGLRNIYQIELDAIGCRNEKGMSLGFAKYFRKKLDDSGFKNVKLHAFDHWPEWKLDFIEQLMKDKEALDAIDIWSAHTFNSKSAKGIPVSQERQALAVKMNKPIWNTEEHIYKKGFDCAISIVQAFNDNYIRSGVTKILNWYDIAGVYPMQPYSEDPAALLARSPWSGHYVVREALWGYAHYGQFTEVGWQYLNGGCGDLSEGGTFVTLKSPGNDYSVIIETKDAKRSQEATFRVSGALSKKDLCVWRSNETEQFVRQADIKLLDGGFALTLEPHSIYSISTTTGQVKGSFDAIPADKPFPFPYLETFEGYSEPKASGYLPRYTADIAGAFEIVDGPDGRGKALRQIVPVPTLSWAPDWNPFTIFGDESWSDYEVSADIYLNAGDSAAVMGRINHVGTGYGFTPKCYYLRLNANGECWLVVCRGIENASTPVGDAEQQAIVKAGTNGDEGGERILASTKLTEDVREKWVNLKLRFRGATITGFIGNKQVLTAEDALYPRGMAGLMAKAEKDWLSTPYYDNVLVNRPGAPTPDAASAMHDQSPIYAANSEFPLEVVVKAPFAMSPIRVPKFPDQGFVITDYGAGKGGKFDNTEAIKNAISACHAAGGGRVIVPAGEWLTAAIHLRSNVNLHLEDNAVLIFSDDPKQYLPAVQSSWEGWECFNYSPLIYAFDCENVAITGRGTLKPRMDTWKQWFERPPAHMEALKNLYTMGSTGVPVERRQMAKGDNNLRPQLIQLNRCRKALIEDIRIRNSPFWCIHLLLCDGVIVRRVDIKAHGHNNDGIDPEGTRNLLVEDCSFDQGDDAIAIKSGTNHDGWRLNKPSENIIIRNCKVVNGHQLVAIGSELSGGVRNVHIHDCQVKSVDSKVPHFNLLYIKTNRRRGGFVENITMENIDAANQKFTMGVLGIETDVLYQWRTLVPAYEERLTPISGITVRNVRVGETATPFRILGDKDRPVTAVVIESVTINVVRGQKNRYENAHDVNESDIHIDTLIEEPDRDNENR